MYWGHIRGRTCSDDDAEFWHRVTGVVAKEQRNRIHKSALTCRTCANILSPVFICFFYQYLSFWVFSLRSARHSYVASLFVITEQRQNVPSLFMMWLLKITGHKMAELTVVFIPIFKPGFLTNRNRNREEKTTPKRATNKQTNQKQTAQKQLMYAFLLKWKK